MTGNFSGLIFTAAWSTPFPADSDIVRIGISRGPPRGHPAGYRMYRKLAPPWWYKSVTAATYVRRYEKEVLSQLDASEVVRDLLGVSGGGPLALMCFEQPFVDGWCHRSLAARWITRETGIEVFEYGFEHLGCGDRHPMLPQSELL